MTAFTSATCPLDWRNPERNGSACRSDGASSVATFKPWPPSICRVRTRKLPAPHPIFPLGAI